MCIRDSAEAALKSVDALSILKSSASRSFYMCQSKKKKYDSTEASTKAYAHWNDGERLLKTSEKYQEYVKDLVTRAENPGDEGSDWDRGMLDRTFPSLDPTEYTRRSRGGDQYPGADAGSVAARSTELPAWLKMLKP